jgi:hypothetical protein
MIRSLALTLLAVGLSGADGLTVTVHGLAREGGLVRVEVQHRPTGHAPGRLVCELRAADATAVLATTSAELADVGRLADGAILVLTVPLPSPPRLRVTVTLLQTGADPVCTAAEVITPTAALTEAAAAISVLRQGGDGDPLPWLWAEQASDLATGSATAAAVGAMQELTRRLAAWSAGSRPPRPGPGLSDQALRDPVDGSVQPYRLHLPPGSGPFPVALLLPASMPGATKAGWAPPPTAELAAAATAGVAVIVCYPAGDRAWDGAAARRIRLTLEDAARRAPLDLGRGVVIASTPPPDAPFASHPAERPTDPAWWRSLPGPPLVAAASGPTGLAAALAAPFTVVVGTAEHRAARTANRRLADAFREAYAAHAHAVPPQVDDDVDPALVAGRNLVLIGNPRSNRLLASLALELPFSWDHRSVHGPGGSGWLRAAGGTVACLAPLADGRLAVIVDGQAPPWGAGLPLAGQPSPLLLAPPRR